MLPITQPDVKLLHALSTRSALTPPLSPLALPKPRPSFYSHAPRRVPRLQLAAPALVGARARLRPHPEEPRRPES